MKINTVTLIGATGTMGRNVAGIFASFGNAKVYMVGRDIEKVKSTIQKTVNSVRADCIASRLIPADFSMLEQCVAESDLIFESSKEDLHIKKEIAVKVASSMMDTAISCTGTSGLSVTEIAECYPEHLRKNFFGVHMFNPPYNMPLCEVIPTRYSDDCLLADLKAYLSTVLYRTVVEVKDLPAFLGNRIGFQFINEALQYAEKYRDNGGIDYIDAILGPFTGRAMAPLVTSDFVGLDVHKAIVDNICQNSNDYANNTFVLPEFVSKLISDGKLGRKVGEGLYKTIRYDDGSKNHMVYDISTGEYRETVDYDFSFAKKMRSSFAIGDYKDAFAELVNNHSQEAEICLTFLLKYIVYSLYCSKEVGYSALDADDVMATGFNWCPPLAMYEALSIVTDVNELIRKCFSDENSIDVESLLKIIKTSKYDFRLFFKSKM